MCRKNFRFFLKSLGVVDVPVFAVTTTVTVFVLDWGEHGTEEAHRGGSMNLRKRGWPLPFLPLPSFPFPPLVPFPFFPLPSPPLLLKSRVPLNQLRGLGERRKLPPAGFGAEPGIKRI